MRQDGRAEFISASLPYDEETDEFKVVKPCNLVSQGACAARREEAVDVALLLHVDDGANRMAQKCGDGAHVPSVVRLSVKRLV